ncbi:Chaperone protein dnaJ [Tilletia horrida]|uniref:Chaperone protein dnaJ n=1 Tax=Tilletia horrida TaxID=155126 RepID=A0AAN6GV66_9BASI|nr:Chaperone protein dnaJ [Tilletia horrida]KAK0556858.1 Chaperone protein dnaJ [Tilletia horrida]KAK0569208.1 Chaperone protein dnaJ [Tilletia horrida]
MATVGSPSYTAAHAAAVTRVQRANGNPYLILDVPQRTTDHAVLKTAKRKGALQLHPDKNRHPGAADAMKQFNEAFEKLIALPAGQFWQPTPVRTPAQPSTPTTASTSTSAPRSSGFAHEDFYKRSKENFERWHQRQRQQQQQQQSANARTYGAYFQSGAHPFSSFYHSGTSGTSGRTGAQRQHDYFTNSGSYGSAHSAKGKKKASAKSHKTKWQHYADEEVEEDDDDDEEDEEDVEYAGFKPSASSKSSTQPPCDHCHKSYATGVWPHPVLQHLRLCRECFKLPRFATVTRDQAMGTYGLTEEEIRMFAENLPPNVTPVAAWARNPTTMHGHPMIRIYLRDHIVKMQKVKLEAQQERHEQFKKRQEESDRRRRERHFAAEASAQGSSSTPRTSAETERARLRREADARAALLERARQAEERRRADAEQEMADRMQRERGFEPKQEGARPSGSQPQPAKPERSHAAPKAETAQQQWHRAKQEGQRSARPAPPTQAEQTRSTRAQESARAARSEIDAILEEILRTQAEDAADTTSRQSQARPAFRPTQGSAAEQNGPSSRSTQAAKSDADQIDEWLQQHMERQRNGQIDSEDDDVILDYEATRRGQRERHQQKKMRPEERRKAAFTQLREDLKHAREADAAAAAQAEAVAAAEHVRMHSSGARSGNGAYRTPYVVSDDSEMELGEEAAERTTSANTSAELPRHHAAAPAPAGSRPSFLQTPLGRPAFTRQQPTRSASVVTISDSEDELEEEDELLDQSPPRPPDMNGHVSDQSEESAASPKERQTAAQQSVDDDDDDFEITSVIYSGGSSTPPSTHNDATQASAPEPSSQQSAVNDAGAEVADATASAAGDELANSSHADGAAANGPVQAEPEAVPSDDKAGVAENGQSTPLTTPRKHRRSLGSELEGMDHGMKSSKRSRIQGKFAEATVHLVGAFRARSIGETSMSAHRRSKMPRSPSIPLSSSSKSLDKKKMARKPGLTKRNGDLAPAEPDAAKRQAETDSEQVQDEESVQEMLKTVGQSPFDPQDTKVPDTPKAGTRRSRTSQGESVEATDRASMPSPAKRPKQRASSEAPFISKRKTRSQARAREDNAHGRASIPADANLSIDGLKISPDPAASTPLDAVFAQDLRIDHRPLTFRSTTSPKLRVGSQSPRSVRTRLGQAPKMAASSPLRRPASNVAPRPLFPTAQEVVEDPSDNAIEDVEMEDL